MKLFLNKVYHVFTDNSIALTEFLSRQKDILLERYVEMEIVTWKLLHQKN